MKFIETFYNSGYEVSWKQFAERMNAEYIIGTYRESDQVHVSHNKWKIKFDLYTAPATTGTQTIEKSYTRVRAMFNSKDRMKFRIFEKGIFSEISKLFGAQDIEVGNSVFDKKFQLKGNNKFKIQNIFGDQSIQEHLTKLDHVDLEICENVGPWDEHLPEGAFALYYHSEEIIRDIEKLEILNEMFMDLLNAMSRIGSAEPFKART